MSTCTTCIARLQYWTLSMNQHCWSMHHMKLETAEGSKLLELQSSTWPTQRSFGLRGSGRAKRVTCPNLVCLTLQHICIRLLSCTELEQACEHGANFEAQLTVCVTPCWGDCGVQSLKAPCWRLAIWWSRHGFLLATNHRIRTSARINIFILGLHFKFDHVPSHPRNRPLSM